MAKDRWSVRVVPAKLAGGEMWFQGQVFKNGLLMDTTVLAYEYKDAAKGAAKTLVKEYKRLPA